MTTRYTDNVSGLDANNGLTELTPKQNLHAHTMANGDLMYIKGPVTGASAVPYNRAGSTYTLDVITLDGITLQRWPGFEKPVITHSGGGGFGRAIGIAGGGSNPVLVSGLKFNATDEGGMGSVGSSTANMIVEDCEFDDIGLANDTLVIGSAMSFGTATPIASLKVYRTRINNTGRACIFGNVTGTYEVAYSTITNPGIANPAGNTGDCIENGGATSNYWVHNNRLIHPKNSKQCVQQSGGTGTALIEDNEMTIGVGTSGNSCKAIYLEMPCTIRRNRIVTAGFAYNGIGASCVFNSNIVIVRGTGWGSNQGPVFPEGLADVDNNTIILQSDGTGFFSGISMYESFPGSIARNNLICNFPVGIRRHSTSTSESFNFFAGCPIPVADENLVTIARNSTSLTGKALLRSDIYPDLASPVIGAGTPIAGYTDYFGAPYNPRPSMGAVERPRSMVRWERGVPYR